MTMTKTFALAVAFASFAALAAALPAQAATRSVDIHAELFADRCAAQGGALAGANPTLACQMPDTLVECSFLTLNTAQCEWAGIDGQIAVNRLIGMQEAHAVEGSSSQPAGAFPGPVKKSDPKLADMK
jgi:hypothetical protein